MDCMSILETLSRHVIIHIMQSYHGNINIFMQLYKAYLVSGDNVLLLMLYRLSGKHRVYIFHIEQYDLYLLVNEKTIKFTFDIIIDISNVILSYILLAYLERS